MTEKHPEVTGAGMELMPWEGTSLDFATTLKAEAALKAIDASGPLADMIGKSIELVHLVAHKVTLTNPETGEAKDAIRLILIDKNGAGFHCVSEGILTSLKMLTSVLDRKPPFDPPLKVTPKQVNTQGGRRVFKLTLS